LGKQKQKKLARLIAVSSLYAPLVLLLSGKRLKEIKEHCKDADGVAAMTSGECHFSSEYF